MSMWLCVIVHCAQSRYDYVYGYILDSVQLDMTVSICTCGHVFAHAMCVCVSLGVVVCTCLCVSPCYPLST